MSNAQLRRSAVIVVLGLAACRTPQMMRLPDTGLARAPDGHVAFIQATPGRLVPTALGDEQATELWIANADGTGARRLVSGAAGDSAQRTLAAMSSPVFSGDGRRVYFLSRAWVTSDAIHVVDVGTGRESFVAPGNSVAVIPRGPLAGCLLVRQHRYWPAGGSYDWTWLITSDGHEVALAAPDSAGEEGRIAEWMAGRMPREARQGSHGVLANVRCT